MQCLVAVAMLAFMTPLIAKADDLADDPQSAGSPPPAATAPANTDLPAICTDRPTKSNNTCTVDEGHFQFESDLFNGTFQRTGGVTTDTYLLTNPTLKYGLTKDIDVEVNIAPYEIVRTHDKFGDSSTLGGIGDLYFTVKYDFYNSADGKFSIAAEPYVKAPTARAGIGDGAWEGGGVLTIAYKLTDALTVTTQPEVDDLKNTFGDGRHVNTAQLIDLNYSLPNNVSVAGELWGDWNYDPTGTIKQYSADAAISWGVTKYFQLDAGLNFGLNRATPGVQAYVGVSQKF
jgi:hypothetical protein